MATGTFSNPVEIRPPQRKFILTLLQPTTLPGLCEPSDRLRHCEGRSGCLSSKLSKTTLYPQQKSQGFGAKVAEWLW